MKKTKKIQYIEDVRSRIEDAPNHGHQGNSWLCPRPWTVAYNIKMRSFLDCDKLRGMMSKLQNEYYTDDDALYELYYQDIEVAWDCLREQLREIDSVEEVWRAGRRDGWCEVTYSSIDIDFNVNMDKEYPARIINEVYLEAVKLANDEAEARATIEHEHRALNEYIDSDEYYIDCVEQLMSNDNIREYYQSQSEKYAQLAQN